MVIAQRGTETIFGMVLGVIFMSIVYNAFAMANINPYRETIVIGTTLIVAVFLVDFFKRVELAIH